MSKKLTLVVPAILAVSVTAVSFGMTSGRAADECLSGPKGTAPEGRHWYYRVDRATGRHCWYLGAKGTKVRQSSRSPSHRRAAPAREPDAPVKAKEPDAPVKKSVAPPTPEPVTRSVEPAPPPARHASAAAPNELAPTNAPIATRFSQFWPSLRAPIDIAQTAPANNNASANASASVNAGADAGANAVSNTGGQAVKRPAPADPQTHMPASPASRVSPVSQAAPAMAAARAPAPIIRTEQMLALMVGALSLAGLIMVFTYKLASMRRPRGLAAGHIGASNVRVQLQPFGHTGVLPRPATPMHHPVITKRGDPTKRSEMTKRIAELDRELHEARRLRELRELREGLETRLEELRHARSRSAA